MKPEPIVMNLQATILAIAEERLGRSLDDVERSFVTRREGLLALEAIHDTVSSLSGIPLEQYLRSEAESGSA
jgi:hypothetical protein